MDNAGSEFHATHFLSKTQSWLALIRMFLLEVERNIEPVLLTPFIGFGGISFPERVRN